MSDKTGIKRDRHVGFKLHLDRDEPEGRDYRDRKMEAEYMAHYLGCSMLSKGTTGLGVIQKPLSEKYFAFRKSTDNRLGPEVGIRVNPSGLVLVFPGANPDQDNEEFYELSSIHFIEAVRFVTVKHKDKKFHGAFVPIDESRAKNASQDKLFVQIDKKSNHLTKISHPAMLACVMRRPTGVKAVDCHMFVVPVVEDALQIADMVHDFQNHPVHPDYVPNYGQPPPGRHDRFPNPDVIPRDMGPRDSGKRESGEEYALYRGRGLELRQEHFRKSNDYDVQRSNEQTGDFRPNRSFERDRPYNTRPDHDRGPDDRYRSDYGDRNEYSGGHRSHNNSSEREEVFVERRPREFKATRGYVERDSMGREFEFDNVIAHERQRSNELERSRATSDRTGGSSPRIGNAGRYERPISDGYQPNRFRDRSPEQSPREPPWSNRGQGQVQGYRDEPQRKSYDETPGFSKVTKQLPRSPLSPRDRSPPRAHLSPRAPSPQDDEVYSASNLESRQEADVRGKPIAKVPPHRHAGIRVLPSLPLAGVKNQLKPVTKPSDGIHKDKQEDKAPAYNFYNKNESDEENPYDNAGNTNIPYGNARNDRTRSDNSPQIERRTEGSKNDVNRVKSGGYPNENNNNCGGKPSYSGEQSSGSRKWSYEDEKEKFLKKEKGGWNGGNKSKSAHDFRDHETNYSDREQKSSKDAEIADMFSYLGTSNNARDIDFESGLGYLP